MSSPGECYLMSAQEILCCRHLLFPYFHAIY